jgi:hypothetical protein
MNNINFNQTGGFPLSTNILDALQTAYTVFNSLGNLAGNLAIISGCDVTGLTVSDGFVFINGELFDFKGGTIGENVIIMQDVENRSFEDGSSKPVLYKRYATFGTALENYPWEGFKRIFPTTLIKEFKDDHEKRIEELENKTSDFKIGMVLRWDQPISEPIPTGWVAVTDSTGKVLVGHDPNDPDFNIVGKTGGAKTHTLTEPEMPTHNHDYNDIANNSAGGAPGPLGGYDGGNNRFHSRNLTTSSKGGNQPHNNLQPYVVVRWIKYVGI